MTIEKKLQLALDYFEKSWGKIPKTFFGGTQGQN